MSLNNLKRLLKTTQKLGVVPSIRLLFGNSEKLKKIESSKYCDFFFKSNQSNRKLIYDILVLEEYNSPYLNDFKKNVNLKIIDLGANIGLFAIYIKSLFPDCSVVCIEPDQENFEYLKANTNKLKNTICLNNAIWPVTRLLKLSDPFGQGKWGLITTDTALDEEYNTQSITMIEILKKMNWETVDILKIDIEGSEKNIFDSEYESWLPKIKLIIIEFHDRFNKGCTKSFLIALNKCWNDYVIEKNGENFFFFRSE